MKKPVIGIVTKHYKEEQIRPDTYIRDEVKQAILDNGGIPIGILPPDKTIKRGEDNWKNDLNEDEYENLIKQIQLCDGIVFQGGAESDNYECIVARYCYDNDIPTLGICCGQNIIVRALGGTTERIPNPEKHNKKMDTYVHDIQINPTSHFYKIVKTEKMMVNSRHKRTIKECPFLEKVAFCEDGYADVIEAPNKTFYIGVRFHPESLYTIDKKHNKIFEDFIHSCQC